MAFLNRNTFILVSFCMILIVQNFLAFSIDPNEWNANFEPSNITVHMNDVKALNLTLNQLDTVNLVKNNATISVVSDTKILQVSKLISLDEIVNGSWSGSFNVSAIFLGNANVFVRIEQNGSIELSRNLLPIVIIREERLIDTIFTISVASLVSILYINFGAALDLAKLKNILLKPIGPTIAFFGQFLFLPLSSYFLGLLLFPSNVELQLGLFFTGISPSGGASNIWCAILNGNIDLSIAMTTTNTFCAFGMMPLWVFILGRFIFKRGNLIVPYGRIAMCAVGLIIPLCIGLWIQRRYPKLAQLLVRILKTFSSMLIVFIVIFAIATNLYLFELFTWQILVAGLGLPWISYIFGWLIAKLFRRDYEDCLAISIESGIQNTGIAIFVLRFALGQPQADLTTVIPVAVAIMTPLPLTIYYFYQKFKDCLSRRGKEAVPIEELN